MGKFGRNDPCPCGSGKKFKKCCVDIVDSAPRYAALDITSSDYTEFTKKYHTIELLKLLAVMQLRPENHGKNVRMDGLIVSAINTFNTVDPGIDLVDIRRDFNLSCERSPHEDPVEDFFTENLIFFNGNHTVYQGNFIEGKEIVQGQLDTLLSMREVSAIMMREISQGLIFLLYIHQRIALALGHTCRMEKPDYGDELFLPNENVLIEQRKLIEFTPEQLEEMCRQILVPVTVIDEFVYQLPKDKLRLNHPDDNPLYRKPFIYFEGKYILVMPTAQLSCMNNFILAKLRHFKVFEDFRQHYADLMMQRADVRFRSMYWTRMPYQNAKRSENSKRGYQGKFYKFDEDKVSYVMLLWPMGEMDSAAGRTHRNLQKDISANLDETLAQFKKENPLIKVFFVLLTAKYDIFQYTSISQPISEFADRSLHLTIKELNVLRVNWDLDHLSLWKYAGHVLATKKEITFMPLNSHLSIFKWYKDNHDWFFHSDNPPSSMMFFEFEIEGEENRKAKRKEDLIGIAFPRPEGLVYVACHKSEDHMPIYLCDEFTEYYRNCLLRYTCPIWVQSNQQHDYTASVYMNAVLYWLNYCFPQLENWMSKFGSQPIIVTLMMDDSIYLTEQWDLGNREKDFKFSRQVSPEFRAVELEIQADLITHLINSGNGGEKFLISELLDLIGELMEQLKLGDRLNVQELEALLSSAMPLSKQKMILITEASSNPRMAEVDVRSPRFIQSSEISYIMHHQVSWLEHPKSIPKKLGTSVEKIKLLNGLVKIHFNKLIEMIHLFPTNGLLVFLMRKHESVIQAREKGKLTYPTLEACYGHYYDVFQEFSKGESDMVATSLALRSLIEFAACEQSLGSQIPNDDDVDLMLALMSELINYGSMSDMIHYGIFDPGMGLLPSGRIGIEQTFGDTTMSSFKREVYLEEVEGYRSSFERHFAREKIQAKAQRGDNPYFDRVDDVFQEEWGITLWDILGACRFLCLELFHNGLSVALLTEQDLLDKLTGNMSESVEASKNLLKLLSFERRDGVMNVRSSEKHETFPWRYNRRGSYLLKPLIKIDHHGEPSYLISARHLLTAAENMVARFMDGTLKVGTSQYKLINLLAERNHIKGKNFRDAVAEWLLKNTDLQVFEFEVKIKPRGFFHADTDKGDIDILCIDHQQSKILAVECKNTSQARIAYEMYTEISNYIGFDDKPGMIYKHVVRDAWLKEHLEEVCEKLELKRSFTVESLVLTRHVLPTKFIKTIPIKVHSYSELKRGDVFRLNRESKNNHVK